MVLLVGIKLEMLYNKRRVLFSKCCCAIKKLKPWTLTLKHACFGVQFSKVFFFIFMS